MFRHKQRPVTTGPMYTVEYAKAALRYETDLMSKAANQTGALNQLNKSVYQLARFYAHDVLSRNEAYNALREAAWSKGEPTYHDFNIKFDEVFENGWLAGFFEQSRVD